MHPLPAPAEFCDRDGWLTGPGVPRLDRAWREGEPVHGCSNLHCGACGRRVLHFDGCLLAARPAPGQWAATHDARGWVPFLVSDAGTSEYRLGLCGCRAFPAGRPAALQRLALEDALAWACEGHPESLAEPPHHPQG